MMHQCAKILSRQNGAARHQAAALAASARPTVQTTPKRTFFAAGGVSCSGRATTLRHGHGHGEFDDAPTVKIIFKKDNKNGADPDGDELEVAAPVPIPLPLCFLLPRSLTSR